MRTSDGSHKYPVSILVSVLLAFGSRGVVYGQGHADATLSGLTVSPADIVGFDSSVFYYHVGVAHSVAQVTITATATDPGAMIQIGTGGTDRNTVASGSGHSVTLVEGRNQVGVWVTSSDGNTTRTYWILVGRGVESAFGWKAVEDFNTLYAAGNRIPGDIWSDGETLWVTDGEDDKLYAYNMQTKARDRTKDFDTLIAAGNEDPGGIWSDGETMWVADRDRKVYAYDLATKERKPSREFDFSDQWALIPTGLWSDGKFMYVPTAAFSSISRYDLKNEVWDSGPSVVSPRGLWSDGKTLWVANGFHYRLHAINLTTNEPNADKYFNTLEDAGCIEPYGIWSDGSTMWVVAGDKIYSFNMPTPNVSYDSDSDGLIEIGSLAQLNAIRWDLDGDGAVDDAANASDYGHAFPNAVEGMGCPTTGFDADDNDCTGYELTAGLDFDTNGDGAVDAADNCCWDGGAGWAPIGSSGSGNEFIATFEGNDHTIDNLYIDRAASEIGLFGVVGPGGRVRNVGLRDALVFGEDNANVGGLAGINRGSIFGCDAAMLASAGESSNVGGLAGANTGSIAASHATGKVYGESDCNAGGLVGLHGVGDSRNRAIIAASYATSTVGGSDGNDLGGLIGLIAVVGSGTSAIVNTSYATGGVSGGSESNDIGGLVGRIAATGSDCRGVITASYATGTVSGIGSNVGGLVGHNFSGGPGSAGVVAASYATGEVTGDGNVGGLVGQDSINLNSSNGIINSYWNTETSGQASSDGGAGKTSVELVTSTGYAGIYVNWNLDLDGDGTDDDPWDFGTPSEYPMLRADFDGDGDVDAIDIDPQRRAISSPAATTDFNGDGQTDFADFFLFADAYGSTNARYDLDGSGTVDFADFFKFIDAFGA